MWKNLTSLSHPIEWHSILKIPTLIHSIERYTTSFTLMNATSFSIYHIDAPFWMVYTPFHLIKWYILLNCTHLLHLIEWYTLLNISQLIHPIEWYTHYHSILKVHPTLLHRNEWYILLNIPRWFSLLNGIHLIAFYWILYNIEYTLLMHPIEWYTPYCTLLNGVYPIEYIPIDKP